MGGSPSGQPDGRSRLELHPDRLLPSEPGQRALARTIYQAVREAPLICPHGHVDPQILLDDQPFADPVSLLLSPDHYITRLLHASGIELAELGVAQGRLSEAAARRAWRLLCEHWQLFRGTPVRYWLEAELAGIFDVHAVPSAASADSLFDELSARLTEPGFRPRALHDRFGISVLATTDDPCSDLAAHRALAADPGWTGRVVPTFRPDRYLEPVAAGWPDAVSRLGAAAGIDTADYPGYLAALEQRRRYFIEHGAVSADHSHADARTDPLPATEAARIYRAALAGEATASESIAFRRHMLFEMARMSCDDGLVMTLHPGVRRDHHSASRERYGADIGCDIPIQVEFTDALRPLLQRYGTAAGFHLVVFTVDETVWSRELAPLAGFYPCVYLGVPWWFLDAPDAIRRFREAVTETAGFTRTSGFVDDTRAFCSIPARHDMSRRLEAGYLARLVAEHRLSEDEAVATARELVTEQPISVFKL
ncbi:MAG TPA: glucuronate isomerase [Jatrophihabitans sp.]|nr:glucuronate isomerase [Jatrophihabitans sp.]